MSIERQNTRFDSAVEKRLLMDFKVGAAAGWTVRAGANSWMATMAASGTDATLMVPCYGLKEGDVIIGFHCIGQIESAGNTATLDASLYEGLPVAAGSTHTQKAGTAMTVLSVTADTAVTDLNASKNFDPSKYVTVSRNANYFIWVEGTTAASTDIELLGVVLYVKPAR